MKAKLLTLLAVLIVCAAAMTYDRWHVPAAMPPATAPDTPHGEGDAPAIAFKTTDNAAHDLRALPERGIILHFWASWCAPCMLEFPPLLQRVTDARGRLALVAVSIDDDRSAMDAFLARLKRAHAGTASNTHTYWVWDADKKISLQFFNVIRVPETVLIDSNRRLVGKIVGDPGWAGEGMEKKLKNLEAP
jgi:thiol-disulfide isomerase/thioredoxin